MMTNKNSEQCDISIKAENKRKSEELNKDIYNLNSDLANVLLKA